MVRTIAYIAVTLVIVGVSAWVFLAVFYSDLWPKLAGKLLAVLLVLSALAALASFAARRWRLPAFAMFLLVFLGVLLWWSSIEPSNDRS